jgi:Fe-S cluster assembly iron-binding protein IscA
MAGIVLSEAENFDRWVDLLPFVGFGVMIAFLALWTFHQPFWVEITTDAILVRRLASERQYGPKDLLRCAFELSPEVWGPLPPRQETGETRCKFRFVDGVQFDATLGVRKARLLHAAVDRLTRGAGRWIAEDPDAAAYAQNPIRLTSRALEALRKAARKAGLGGRAIVLAGVQPSPDDSDGFIYQLDLVEGVPPGSILTESVGRLIAVEREDAALLAGVIIDFNRGAGGTGFLFIRTDTPDTPALAV